MSLYIYIFLQTTLLIPYIEKEDRIPLAEIPACAPVNALSSFTSGQSKRPNKQTDTLQISSPNSHHVTLPS